MIKYTEFSYCSTEYKDIYQDFLFAFVEHEYQFPV